ncbi:MAG: RNA ligase family protein, partial [Promethearchaeota archaeon]
MYIFSKLDGSNATLWFSGDSIGCGSRNRELTAEKDNAGFRVWVNELGNKNRFLELKNLGFSHCNVYGEWMVPHTLRTYREDTWRRFWIFDVFDRDKHCYLPYEEYAEWFTKIGLDVIEPLCVINNPT